MLTLNNMNSRPSFRVVRGATLLVALIAIAILGSSSCTQPTSEVSNGNAPANSNNAAPANKPSGATSNLKELPASAIDAELKTLDGKTLRLADYKGKVVVLDLWATWCGPCRQEIPHLVALRNDYAARGVEVIGLTIEDPETTMTMCAISAKNSKSTIRLASPMKLSRARLRARARRASAFRRL